MPIARDWPLPVRFDAFAYHFRTSVKLLVAKKQAISVPQGQVVSPI
jgi:hypothetical protein